MLILPRNSVSLLDTKNDVSDSQLGNVLTLSQTNILFNHR